MKYAAVLSLVVLFSLNSCKETNPGAFSFDRQPMLEAYWDELINPAFEEVVGANKDIKTAWDNFTATPDVSNLEMVRENLFLAWTSWQYLAPYDFGPFSDAGILASLNTHPTDQTTIEGFITTGSWNLETADNIDAIGYPALDYLLNSENAYTLLTTDASAAVRTNLVSDIIDYADISGISSELSTYREVFVQAIGTDAGSSTGMMINALNRYLERNFRDGKVGIPLGEKTLGIPQPESAEALFDGRSPELLSAAAEAYRNLFDGAGNLGLEEYVAAAVEFQNTGEDPLQVAIRNQIEELISEIVELDIPVSEAVTTDPEKVQEIHLALQQLGILMKVDMPSVLGILITYQDNDGD